MMGCSALRRIIAYVAANKDWPLMID